MANCGICNKVTAVSLYVRVKPIWDGIGPRWTATKDKHHFFGYWPPDSHLVQYIREEIVKGPYLHQLFERNCRGHSVDEIIEVIETKAPPEPGIAIKVLWNPGSKVKKYLLAETPEQLEQAEIELSQELRTVIIRDKAQIRQQIYFLFNNTLIKVPASVSLPGTAVKTFDAPYAARDWTPAGAAQAATEMEAAQRVLWERILGMTTT